MYTLLESVRVLFNLLEVLIIVRIFVSVFKMPVNNLFGKILYELTEPIMSPARTLLDKIGVGRSFIDFSPWVAIIFLRIIYTVLLNLVT